MMLGDGTRRSHRICCFMLINLESACILILQTEKYMALADYYINFLFLLGQIMNNHEIKLDKFNIQPGKNVHTTNVPL